MITIIEIRVTSGVATVVLSNEEVLTTTQACVQALGWTVGAMIGAYA